MDLTQYTARGNATVYAIWTHNPIITEVDGTQTRVYTADYDGYITPIIPDPRAGYKFIGFGLNSLEPIPILSDGRLNHIFTEDTYLQVLWEKLPVVTFNLGVQGGGQTYSYVTDETYHVVPPAVDNTGDYMATWVNAKTGNLYDFAVDTFRADTIIMATWAPIYPIRVHDMETGTVFTTALQALSNEEEYYAIIDAGSPEAAATFADPDVNRMTAIKADHVPGSHVIDLAER